MGQLYLIVERSLILTTNHAWSAKNRQVIGRASVWGDKPPSVRGVLINIKRHLPVKIFKIWCGDAVFNASYWVPFLWRAGLARWMACAHYSGG
jgi:hypothetical protein